MPVKSQAHVDLDRELRLWLIAGLQKPGKTTSGLAEHLGLAQPRVAEMKQGRRLVRATELGAISQYLEEPLPASLQGYGAEERPALPSVPVAGYVVAGGRILLQEGASDERVEAPPGSTPTTIAAVVSVDLDGEAGILVAGDVLFFDLGARASVKELNRKVCAVRDEKGNTYIGVIHSTPRGSWFVDANRKTHLDMQIKWATPLRWVKIV